MATLRQTTSFGPGTYRGRKFTKADLESYAEGTNKAIAAGIPIPLLKRHAPIDANDTATAQFSKEEGAGWITQLGVDGSSGALWWEAKDVPEQDAKDVEAGKTRFTSPEFRPSYTSQKAGVYTGKLVRHMAFSIKPGNPHQGAIERTDALALAESETAWQFDESERKPLETTQHAEKPNPFGKDVTPSDDSKSRDDSAAPLEDKSNDPTKSANPAAPATNPDMPPKATDKSKLAAIIAGLSQKNVVVPSDWDPTAEGAMDILLGCLNSAIAAENKAKAEAEPADPDDEPVTDAPMPFDESKSSVGAIMFSKEELAAMPEALRAKAELQNKSIQETTEKAAQFDEERRITLNNAARDKAIGEVTAAKIPPALRATLLAGYKPTKDGDKDVAAAIQFDEGEEQPLYTASQVADMVAKTLPPNFQFDEKKVGQSELPKVKPVIGYNAKGEPIFGNATPSEQFFEEGELPAGHMTAEQAEKVVNASPIFGAHQRKTQRTSLAQDVAENTRNNPSNMVQ